MLPKSNTDAGLRKRKSLILPRQVLDVSELTSANMNKYIWQLSLNKEVVPSILLENLLWVGITKVVPFFICHSVEFSDILHAKRISIQYN